MNWIEWKESGCPVAEDVILEVKTRDGRILGPIQACFLGWGKRGLPSDIVGYCAVGRDHAAADL